MLIIDTATIREHSPALFSFALRVLHQREEAEDMVQETWISALKSVPNFEGRASLRTWLTRILQRRIADRFRKLRAFTPLEEDALVADETPPEAWLDARQMAELSARTLEVLSPLEKRAVMLDVQQLDRDEAAELLGVTRGHLRVLLFRGRQKLEAALRDAGFAGTPESGP